MIPARRRRRLKSTVAGLGTHSLFLSFVLPSVFCSFLLSLYAHQLPGLGCMSLPYTPIHFFFVLSFLSLFLGIVVQ